MGSVIGMLTLLLLMAGHSSLARTAPVTNTAPGSTTQPAGTQLSINKLVDKTTARIGDVLSYTLVISNVGSTTATNVVARDSNTTGLRYVLGSASVPAGSTFSSGAPISTWTVPSIGAGQSFSLTFQAVADSSGILYTKATIPGDTATVCTSVPVKVCTGDTYLFRLTAAPGRSSYKWFKNGIELTTQTTNVLDVTATGTYSLAIDNVSGRCPDFSCCPFVVEEDTLPTFRATILPVTCVTGTAQTNGRITLTNYNPAYTYQYSAGADFNATTSLSGSAKTIPADGVIVTNLANPGSAQPYTIRVFNASGCYTDVTVTMQPTGCCALSAVATAGVCQPATNTYSATTVVTLTNPTTGVLTVSNGPQSTTFATTSTATASFTAVFANLTSDGLSHTVTASLPGCSTVTTTYTAPASCSVTPAPTLALSALPGDCQSATNGYILTGTLSMTNASAGTATLTDGSSTTSISVNAGVTSVPYSLSGLPSGTGSHTLTVAYAGLTSSQTYTAPASCSVAPVCSLSALVTAGACQSATNMYSATTVVTLTNPTTGVLTVSNGPQSTTFATGANSVHFTAVFEHLVSDSLIHMVTASLPGCSTVTAAYTAPASCSVTPAPTLALRVITGDCQTTTNTYSLTGTLSLTNAIAGTATITDGSSITSVPVIAGANSVPYSLSGLMSGTGLHTVTVSYASQTLSQTYTAPLSCSVSPVCSLSATVTAGICASATNTFSASVVVNLTNTQAGTLTVSLPGSPPFSQTITAATHSVTAIFDSLLSDALSHTATVSLPGCATTTATFTAPASCSVAVPATPVCSLSALVTAGACQSATNMYSATTVVTLTNPTTGVLTVSNGPQSTTFATTSTATASFTAVFANLTSDGLSHTVTASLPGCSTVTTTYTAPASCSVTPAPTLALSALPGDCQSATNGYSVSGTLSLTNATAGTATLTDGSSTATVSVSVGASSVPYSLSGLISGTNTHTLSVSYATQTLSTTYTAPASCSVTPAPSVVLGVTPGLCQSATNGYTISGTLSLTNASAGTATLTDGSSTTSVSVSAGVSSIPYSLSGLTSGTGSHTVTVNYAGQTMSTTYTAPLSCSVVATQLLSLSVSPGLCQPATNGYAISGTLSLTNALAGTATITDGTVTATIPVKAGDTALPYSLPYSLSGLVSGSGSHTITVTYLGQTSSQTYTAPLSCSVTPVCSLSATVLVSACAPVTNTFSTSVVVSLTNIGEGTITVSLPGLPPFSQAVKSDTRFLTAIFDGLLSDGASHTATVSLPGCATTTAIFTAPASCSVTPAPTLALSVTPGDCQSATDGYTVSGTLSLTNASAGTATLTDGTTATSVSVSAGVSSVPYSLSGLISGTGLHTVTVSYASQTQSLTYTAPLSCTTAPVCSLSATVTAGLCQSATNTFSSTVVVTIANPTTATLTVTNTGQTQLLGVTAATTSVTAIFDNIISDGSDHTVAISLPDCTSMTVAYTAPVSCSAATRTSLSVADPGICDPATNTYTTTGIISLTNATTGTATLTDGSSTTLIAIGAGATSIPYSLSGLASGTGLHTVTVSYLGQTASTTYTAPASCSVTPIPTLVIRVTPGDCQSATNGYTVTGTLSLTNALAGTATITDGTATATIRVNAGDTALPYSLSGLSSGTGSHTVTVSYATQTVSQTYTAPLSCSVTPAPLLSLSLTPGDCQSATNGYTISGTLSLTNAIVGTATLTDGNATTTVSVNAGVSSIPYSLSGLPSGTNTHTVSVSYATQTLSTTYTAPASCSVTPAPTLALSVTPGDCQSATNGYSVSGTLSLTNATAGTATLTDGTNTNTISVSAGASSVPYSLSGLSSGTGSHTLSVSYASQTISQTYTAPLSCSVAVPATPVCSVSAVAKAIPATCQDNMIQANGQIVLSGFNPDYTYQYSAGASFDPAASGPAKVIPADGMIVNTLANPAANQPYTVRVYGKGDCYTDVTLVLKPVVCDCTAEVCVPFVIEQSKRAKRIGDAR